MIWDLLGGDNRKFLGQGEFLDKDALFASMGFRLVIFSGGCRRRRQGAFQAATAKHRWLRWTLPRNSPCLRVTTV